MRIISAFFIFIFMTFDASYAQTYFYSNKTNPQKTKINTNIPMDMSSFKFLEDNATSVKTISTKEKMTLNRVEVMNKNNIIIDVNLDQEHTHNKKVSVYFNIKKLF